MTSRMHEPPIGSNSSTAMTKHAFLEILVDDPLLIIFSLTWPTLNQAVFPEEQVYRH